METSVAPAMPCQIVKNCGSGASNKIKTRLACILEAGESHKTAYGRIITKSSWRPYCRKRRQLTAALQFGTQIYSYAPSHEKILHQRQLWTREWKRFRRGTWRKSEVRKRWSMKQGTSGAKVHFASLIDICHWKNGELETKHQKYKGRVVLRGDIVKDDSGSYAVFTEQGSSASQMTAAKVMDIISRLPGCAGQAADAASASTQVKMRDAPQLLKIPKSECPDIWIRPPRHKWHKSCSSMEDSVVPLERNL